jgi:hypothetical protein
MPGRNPIIGELVDSVLDEAQELIAAKAGPRWPTRNGLLFMNADAAAAAKKAAATAPPEKIQELARHFVAELAELGASLPDKPADEPAAGTVAKKPGIWRVKEDGGEEWIGSDVSSLPALAAPVRRVSPAPAAGPPATETK